MYMPPQFDAKDRGFACELMRQQPFASLISNDDAGLPFVTHLPIHVIESADAITLLGHVAKPNPHWKFLQARPQAVVTFMGPHAYLSPKVYPDLVRVPSWNYLAVHCTVQAKIIDEPQAKDALLKCLIGDHEPAYAAQWRSLDEDYTRKMLNGIVAFELVVENLQCKFKLNQHRPEAQEKTRAIYAAGDDNQRALAAWMDRLGLGSPSN